MNIKLTYLILLLPAVLFACQNNNKVDEANNNTDPEPLELTINFEDRKQEIEGSL